MGIAFPFHGDGRSYLGDEAEKVKPQRQNSRGSADSAISPHTPGNKLIFVAGLMKLTLRTDLPLRIPKFETLAAFKYVESSALNPDAVPECFGCGIPRAKI